MKEISVLCNLYLEVDDDVDMDEAIEKVMFMLDPDLQINIHNTEMR